MFTFSGADQLGRLHRVPVRRHHRARSSTSACGGMRDGSDVQGLPARRARSRASAAATAT